MSNSLLARKQRLEEAARITRKYEDFLDNTLRAKLEEQITICRETSKKLGDLKNLRINIEELAKKHRLDWDATAESRSMDTLINLGISHVFAKAHVPNTEKIFIETGMGFYVEMTLDEALNFLEVKEKYLNDKFDKQVEKTTQTKAEIHQMLYLLGQLQETAHTG